MEAPYVIPERTGQYYAHLDWGFGDHAAYGLWWHSPQNELILVDELYERQLRPSELGERILALEGNRRVAWRVAGCDAWAKDKEGQIAPAEIWQRMGLVFRQARRDRIPGWQAMREWLAPYQVETFIPDADSHAVLPSGLTIPGVRKDLAWTARMRAFPHCRNWARTIPDLVYHPTKPEDVADNQEDHHADGTRYLVMELPTPTPITRRPVDQATDLNDDWRAREGLVPKQPETPTGRTAGW
jgi:hypothetical protein